MNNYIQASEFAYKLGMHRNAFHNKNGIGKYFKQRKMGGKKMIRLPKRVYEFLQNGYEVYVVKGIDDILECDHLHFVSRKIILGFWK